MFEALRAKQDQLAAEKRELANTKEVSSHQASMQAADDQNTMLTIESRADLHKWQAMLQQDFDRFYWQLGYKENRQTGELVPRGGNTNIACNTECITNLKIMLDPFMHRSVSITKFDGPTIQQLLLNVLTTVSIDLAANMHEYAINNTADLSRIRNAFENIVHPILLRSIDGFTKITDSSVRKILENAGNPNNERATMFQKLSGMIGG